MSDHPDEQHDANQIERQGQGRVRHYFAIVGSALQHPILYLKKRRDKEAAEDKRKAANDELVAAATHKMARYTFWIALFTFISVATAGLTLVVLWREREDARRTQRAFLYVSKFDMREDLGITGQRVLRVIPEWINSGDTPTRNARITLSCKGRMEDLDWKSVDPTPAMLGPKQVKAHGHCDWNVPKTIELQTKVASTGYIGARATYEDVFGISHVTEFCGIFPVTQRFDSQKGEIKFSVGGTFVYCPTHNCSDDECKN